MASLAGSPVILPRQTIGDLVVPAVGRPAELGEADAEVADAGAEVGGPVVVEPDGRAVASDEPEQAARSSSSAAATVRCNRRQATEQPKLTGRPPGRQIGDALQNIANQASGACLNAITGWIKNPADALLATAGAGASGGCASRCQDSIDTTSTSTPARLSCQIRAVQRYLGSASTAIMPWKNTWLSGADRAARLT